MLGTCNSIASPGGNSQIHGQLVFKKGLQTTQWKKDSLFYTWQWGNEMSTCRRMELEPYLMAYPKINSKLDQRSN
jgi:hypothetical protein